jgi:ribosomal protein S8
MKYEDWIKYEEQRKQSNEQKGWITLQTKPDQHPKFKPKQAVAEENTRVWTMIVQIFNSRRI